MTLGGQGQPYQPPQPQRGSAQHAPYPQHAQNPGYSTLLAQPVDPLAPAAPPAPAPAPAIPVLPVPTKKGRSAWIWLFGVLGFVLLILIGYFVVALGTGASIVGLVLAVFPLALVFFGIYLIDRWEPEPKGLVIFAISWGAIAAIAITLGVDLLITLAIGLRPEEIGAVIQAPIIEEVAKGLGILIIFLMGRRTFDGPIDGIVYGALIGAGFAFTENIQYFAVSFLNGGTTQLTATFFVRGLLSPFAHAMFTSLTGFTMGLSARRHARTGSVFGAGLIGILGAMLLHGFWNGSATFANFFLLYITLQVPLFLGFIIAIIALRREEARVTRERLSEYAAAGWFTPQEVTMLGTSAGRKAGLAWAARLRGDRRPLMRSLIKDATALAAVRQRALTGRDPLAAQDERALLVRTRATRAALLAY